MKKSNPDFITYLFEYLYRYEIRTENELTETMNSLQIRQSVNVADYDLVRAIRARAKMDTVEQIIADVWKIYDFSE